MSLADHFRLLGAPLSNDRWSWGGIRDDGSVILRAWAEEMDDLEDGKGFYVGYPDSWPIADQVNRPGNIERVHHLEMIANGARCFVVMIHGLKRDPNRANDHAEIKSFDRQSIFECEPRVIIGSDGGKWVKIKRRYPVTQYLSERKAAAPSSPRVPG